MAKNMKSGLGKGLTDLFGGEELVRAEEQAAEGISRLPMTMIEPNGSQPRKVFDPQALEELTDSIRMHGIVTPITVRKRENGYYQIIAGERRWRAARNAGLTEIPAMVIEANDEQVMELALIENLQREDLNPIEEAEGLETLVRDYGMTQEKVAERVGKSRPAVANALRLLSLTGEARAMVADGRLSSGHARALLSIKDPEKREAAAKQMEDLSVRQAESLAKKLNQAAKIEPAPAEETQVNYVTELEHKLEGQLGRRVRIEIGKTHGMLSLEFYGNEDLERLSDALGGVSI